MNIKAMALPALRSSKRGFVSKAARACLTGGFLFLLTASSCFAQIKLFEQKTESWGGFNAPTTANGIVYSGPGSKPVLIGTQSVIVCDYANYEFLTTYAERIPTLERVALETVSGGYWFPQTAKAGTYRVLAIATANGKAPAIESLVVILGTPKPEPDPDPDPEPPKPDPSVVPIPGEGLRVLIIYEQDDQAKYSPDTIKQLYSLTLRKFLNEQCVKGANGLPEYRVLDEEVEGEPSIWLTAIKRKRESLPWLIISNGKSGFEGPLPAKEADTKSLIERYKL